MSSLFKTLEISATGLSAERFRMDIIANNIANANTVRTVDGVPFRRKAVVLQTGTGDGFGIELDRRLNLAGVEIAGVVEDDSPPVLKFDPGNPNADEEGFVEMPNVNILNEMVDMITATRAYEANVTAIESTKAMIGKALELGSR